MHKLNICKNNTDQFYNALFCDSETLFVYENYDNKLNIEFNNFSADLIVAIIIPEEADLKNNLFIVSILNIINTHMNIYCSYETGLRLKPFSNENLSYIFFKNGEAEIKADILITYGSGALYFLQKKIPVIIIGPYGLGGWVTPKTFPFLLHEGFNGRAGGSLYENVPYSVLLEEIYSVKKHENLDLILKENSALAHSTNYVPFSKIPEIEFAFIKLHESFFNSNKKKELIPRLASNIELIEAENFIFFKRKVINDTLASIDIDLLEFFNKMDGSLSFLDLLKISKMNETDYWELINGLYEKKIFTFHHKIFKNKHYCLGKCREK